MSLWNLHSEEGFIFLSSNFPSKDTKTMSSFFKDEYFTPDGVIKKPSSCLIDTFPDLKAERFSVLSMLAYLITSSAGLIVLILF